MKGGPAARARSCAEQLGLSFNDPQLLGQALTHTSYAAEHPHRPHNERLEFLGDAVLDLVVGEYLYHRLSQAPEGVLTRLRAAHVSEGALAVYAREIGLDQYILLGRGAEMAGERRRPAILADALEAFVGALYLDQGYAAVRDFVEKWIVPRLKIDNPEAVVDAKTRLQEHVQSHGGRVGYELVLDDGPFAEERFTVRVHVDGIAMGEAKGRSKKEAEQRAAAIALASMGG